MRLRDRKGERMKTLNTIELPKDSPWLPYLVANDRLQIMTQMLPELDIEEAEVLIPYLPKGWLGVLEGYLSIAIPFMAGSFADRCDSPYSFATFLPITMLLNEHYRNCDLSSEEIEDIRRLVDSYASDLILNFGKFVPLHVFIFSTHDAVRQLVEPEEHTVGFANYYPKVFQLESL